MTDIQIKTLKERFQNIVNLLFRQMDADEYWNYILGFIFYKHLSHKIMDYAHAEFPHLINYKDFDDSKKEDKLHLEKIKAGSIEKIGYYIAPSQLFDVIAKRGKDRVGYESFILDDLRRIFRAIEESTDTYSQDTFDMVFADIDLSNSHLGRSEGQRNDVIARLMDELANIDFQYEGGDHTILGEVYEYLVSEFASTARKTTGEFYTPRDTSTILTRIVATDFVNGKPQIKKKIKTVYDPACGSGSLLLRFKSEDIEIEKYVGQEIDRATCNLARMNMMLHNVDYRGFDIQYGDTLAAPAHEGEIFEAIVATPPFSIRYLPHEEQPTEYEFIIHMLNHLGTDGRMAAILSQNALFGNRSHNQRRDIIHTYNSLDAVIVLPGNLFFNTSIAVCIMVFCKYRKANDDILFIDASRYHAHDKVKSRNILTNTHIDKIVSTWQRRVDTDRYSRSVSIKEIIENDFNLNIRRYIDSAEPEVEIDLQNITKKLKESDIQLKKNSESIYAYCADLGIDSPYTE